ncbi:MAG: acyloxyacyl hydrolase [Candidatus Auribacterota bacterium]|nr:acyloxyacyl hydrolase [Candidatus Auribacterota bacterium]
MKLFSRIAILMTICAALSMASATSISRGEVDHEVFLGEYVFTPRNLDTRGETAAYRLWFIPEKDRGFSLIYPQPLTLGFEIRGGYLREPEDDWEASLMIDLKYEFNLSDNITIYFLGSTGGNYSGIDYHKVATNFNFTSRGSLGVCIYQAILQASYEHRSNAGIEQPNRGIDLVTVSVGYRF